MTPLQMSQLAKITTINPFPKNWQKLVSSQKRTMKINYSDKGNKAFSFCSRRMSSSNDVLKEILKHISYDTICMAQHFEKIKSWLKKFDFFSSRITSAHLRWIFFKLPTWEWKKIVTVKFLSDLSFMHTSKYGRMEAVYDTESHSKLILCIERRARLDFFYVEKQRIYRVASSEHASNISILKYSKFHSAYISHFTSVIHISLPSISQQIF